MLELAAGWAVGALVYFFLLLPWNPVDRSEYKYHAYCALAWPVVVWGCIFDFMMRGKQ